MARPALALGFVAVALASCDGATGPGEGPAPGPAAPSSVEIDGQPTAFDFGSAELIGRESVTLTADARCAPSGRLCRLTIRLRLKDSGAIPAPGEYHCSQLEDLEAPAGTHWAWLTLSLEHDATPRVYSTFGDCAVTIGRLEREPAWAVSARYSGTMRRSDDVISLSNGVLQGMLMP